MLRTYLVCREKKQTARGRSTQCIEDIDHMISVSELLRQNSVTAHARRLASAHCATENHRPTSAVRTIRIGSERGWPCCPFSYSRNTYSNSINLNIHVMFIFQPCIPKARLMMAHCHVSTESLFRVGLEPELNHRMFIEPMIICEV
jgi:hypothetical protein